MKTLDRYLLREVLAHFSLGLAVIVLLFLAGAVYEVLAPLVAKGADPYTLLLYLFYRTPEALVRGAPVAYLFALLFLLSRLGEDSELKALLALGIRRERVLLPLLGLGALLALFLGGLNVVFWVQTFYSRTGQRLELPRGGQLARPFGFFLVGVGMVILWERLGVVATVLIASFFELKVIEEYSWMRSFWVGLAFSLTTWVLFQVVLRVPLPAGPFEFLSYL